MNEEELDLTATIELWLVERNPRRARRGEHPSDYVRRMLRLEQEQEAPETPWPPAWITSPAGAAAWWAACGHTPSSEDWGAWRREHGRAPE